MAFADRTNSAAAPPPAAACEWARRRGFRLTGDVTRRLLELRRDADATISVIVPVKRAPRAVAAVAAECVALRDAGAVDEVLVVDAAVPGDESGRVAADAGADVRRECDLLPRFGPVLGKGDAMWRSQAVATGDIVVFVDGDSEGFDAGFVCGLAAPLLSDRSIELVKGAYSRPFNAGETRLTDGGGRVSELTARPLLNVFFPELAAVRQPLAGEFAARRASLAKMPFLTGYGAEIQLLIDYYRKFGLDAIAQSDVGERINPHQPLHELGAMAHAVARALLSRVDARRHALGQDAAFVNYVAGEPSERTVELVERPPFASIAKEAANAA